MAYIPDQQINTGSYIPTTYILDVARLYEVDVTSQEFKELLVRLYQTVNSVVLALNTKHTGYYINEEFVNGKLYYNPNSSDPLMLRPGFQKSINTGALGAGTTSINHGIAVTNTFHWMFIYGAATDTVNLLGYPITYAGAAGNNLSAFVNATQVVINNSTGVTFTDSQVTLEYVKF